MRTQIQNLKSKIQNQKSGRRESNPHHLVWKTSTQPVEFRPQKFRIQNLKSKIEIVHRGRFELPERERDSFTDCLP